MSTHTHFYHSCKCCGHGEEICAEKGELCRDLKSVELPSEFDADTQIVETLEGDLEENTCIETVDLDVGEVEVDESQFLRDVFKRNIESSIIGQPDTMGIVRGTSSCANGSTIECLAIFVTGEFADAFEIFLSERFKAIQSPSISTLHH